MKRSLLGATAAFALATGSVIAGPGSLPSPIIQTAPANDNSSTAANTAFVGSAVSTAIANLKTYFGSLLQQNYTLQVPSATALRALVGFLGSRSIAAASTLLVTVAQQTTPSVGRRALRTTGVPVSRQMAAGRGTSTLISPSAF